MIPWIGFSFLPSEEARMMEANISLPSNTTAEATQDLADQIDQQLKDMGLFDKRQMTSGNQNVGHGMRGRQSHENQAIQFRLELKKGVSINSALEKVEKEVTESVQKEIPKATVSVKEEADQGPGGGNHVEIKLYGDNLHHLEQAAKQVEHLFKQNNELKNVSNQMQETRTAWEITLNENGKKWGVSPEQVMAQIHERLEPVEVGPYEMDGKEKSLVLAFDEKIAFESQLKNMPVATPSGKKSLQDIAEIQTVDLPQAILHENGETYATVSATLKGDDTFSATEKIRQDLDALSLPEGVRVEIGGGEEEIQEGLVSLGTSIAVAIGLVFIILTLTYGGLLTPIIILSSLLFVPIGSLTGLLLTGHSLSMSAMIGLLMLVGIVVTNAIVLLDRVESHRKAGIDLDTSLIEAAKTRLRPILMTAIATICALIPLALAGESGVLLSQDLAITVIGGLATSTLLTLVFVPILYAIFGKYRKFEKVDF